MITPQSKHFQALVNVNNRYAFFFLQEQLLFLFCLDVMHLTYCCRAGKSAVREGMPLAVKKVSIRLKLKT